MRDTTLTEARYGAPWTRDELVLALYLYCQIPFAQTKASNPEVVKLAHTIHRSPASVARKLGNFGAFDPILAKQGITGLTHVSKADAAIWNEFSCDWGRLVAYSQQLLAEIDEQHQPIAAEEFIVSRLPIDAGATRTVTVRLSQAFFRRSVLASYGAICCMCGIDQPTLLVASHIIPWAINEVARPDPCNGLCLCALHDRAFDCGMVMVHPSDLTLHFKDKLLSSTNPAVRLYLASLENQRIRLPSRFMPNPEYLAWHADNVYGSQ